MSVSFRPKCNGIFNDICNGAADKSAPAFSLPPFPCRGQRQANLNTGKETMTDDRKIYSHLQVEAALCIWEDLLGRYDAPLAHPASFRAYWQVHGTVAMRHLSIALADYCLAVYDAIPADDRHGHPYDWEIIPAILDTVDWSVGPEILLPPAEAAAIVTSAFRRLGSRCSPNHTASLAPLPPRNPLRSPR